MMELIDEMDLIKNQLWEEGLKDKSAMISDMIKKAVKLLEKEKEQIIAAREDGNMFYLFKSNEQYYNQTYNQNK